VYPLHDEQLALFNSIANGVVEDDSNAVAAEEDVEEDVILDFPQGAFDSTFPPIVLKTSGRRISFIPRMSEPGRRLFTAT
jgi:hypothetical protein